MGKGLIYASLTAILWALLGLFASRLGTSGFSNAPFISLGAGISCLALALVSRIEFKAPPLKYLVALSLIAATNQACFFTALKLAPVGPVMSLHLSTPIILLVALLVRGKRSLGFREVLIFLLLALGLFLIALAPSTNEYPDAIWGYLLALGSASCIAVLINMVSKVTLGVSSLLGSGFQLILSSLILSPLAVLATPPAEQLLKLALIGALFLGPGLAFNWLALRHAPPSLVASMLLIQPAVASLAGWVLYSSDIFPLQLLAGALVLVAAVIELLRKPKPETPEKPPPFGAE